MTSELPPQLDYRALQDLDDWEGEPTPHGRRAARAVILAYRAAWIDEAERHGVLVHDVRLDSGPTDDEWLAMEQLYGEDAELVDWTGRFNRIPNPWAAVDVSACVAATAEASPRPSTPAEGRAPTPPLKAPLKMRPEHRGKFAR